MFIICMKITINSKKVNLKNIDYNQYNFNFLRIS